jgi:type III secretion system YseE family protein
MKKGKRTTMTALERDLSDDENGEAYRQQLIAKIFHQRNEVNAIMNEGISSSEYKAWDEFKRALDDALEVVEKYR